MGNCQICGKRSGFFKFCRACNMMRSAGQARKSRRRRPFYYRSDGSKGYF